MLLKDLVTKRSDRGAIVHRVLLAGIYIPAALLVVDYSTYFLASIGRGGYRMLVYTLILKFALAGSVVLAIASVIALGNLRWGTLCGLLGCSLELPWVALGIPDLIIPHLPLIGYRIHYDTHYLRAELMMVIATVFSFWTLWTMRSAGTPEGVARVRE